MLIGFATVDITPPPGLPLMGNYRDDYAARGVHDPLYAKAAVFRDRQGSQAAILALDLCMLDRDNVAQLRAEAARLSSVKAERILVHATHTHSGPAPNDRYSFGVDLAPHRPAIEAMFAKAAGTVGLAERNLGEATLAAGDADEDRIAFNRRLCRRDGSTQMNWESLAPGFDPAEIAGTWGGIDPQVTCLVVERGHRPEGAIVNYGLHPAILAGDNWLYSADYPGYLAEALRRIHGPQFFTLFLNGCCANVNHVDYREPQQGRGFPMAQRVGYLLAAAVAEAVRQRRPLDEGGVRVVSERVPLRRRTIDPAEADWCRRILSAAASNLPRGQVDGLPDAFWADARLRMLAEQETPAQAEVMTIGVSDARIVGLPGEQFCETGLAIKGGRSRGWPAVTRATVCGKAASERTGPDRVAPTLVAELANDAIGYVPTREAFAQGGYEPTLGSARFGEDSAERFLGAAQRQLETLAGN